MFVKLQKLDDLSGFSIEDLSDRNMIMFTLRSVHENHKIGLLCTVDINVLVHSYFHSPLCTLLQGSSEIPVRVMRDAEYNCWVAQKSGT